MRNPLNFNVILAVVIGLVLACGVAFAESDVTLAWDANSEEDLAGYHIYRAESPGTMPILENRIGTIPAGTETFTDEAIPDGIYWWVATAYDTSDNESGPSNEVTLDLDTTAPAAPTNLIKSAVNKVLSFLLELSGAKATLTVEKVTP